MCGGVEAPGHDPHSPTRRGVTAQPAPVSSGGVHVDAVQCQAAFTKCELSVLQRGGVEEKGLLPTEGFDGAQDGLDVSVRTTADHKSRHVVGNERLSAEGSSSYVSFSTLVTYVWSYAAIGVPATKTSTSLS